MTPFLDLFSAHASQYAAARPTYPRELFAYLATLPPQRACAWDCATGNGQAALDLVNFFDRVIATDASPEQLSHATPHERIEYRLATAEQVDLPDRSIDLVTVAQALHWFRFDDFYANVRRILRPAGILAAWCYGDNTIEPAIDAITHHLEYEIVGPYWSEGRKWIDDNYRHIPFPENEVPCPHTFFCRMHWTLAEYLAYIDTWSAVQAYRKKNTRDPIALVAADFHRAWGDPQSRRHVAWPITPRIARFP